MSQQHGPLSKQTKRGINSTQQMIFNFDVLVAYSRIYNKFSVGNCFTQCVANGSNPSLSSNISNIYGRLHRAKSTPTTLLPTLAFLV